MCSSKRKKKEEREKVGKEVLCLEHSDKMENQGRLPGGGPVSRHEVNLERSNRREAVQAEEEIRNSTFGESGVSKGDGECIR